MSIDFNTIENAFIPTDDGKCSVGNKGMVATQSPWASHAGQSMLKQGGNAVDAAVSAALTLCVTEPQACGLGGQTMMLVSKDKKTIAIDGSSRAPSLAHVSAVYKKDRSSGYRATTVPSTVAAMWYTHKKFGSLNWEQIVEPAIHFATNGYPISQLQHTLQKREYESFNYVASKSGVRYFYKNNQPYECGEIFRQPELAGVLKILQSKGAEPFYIGDVAKRIDADMRENGGLLRFDDLALIPWPIERKPLQKKYRDVTVSTMPPPGSGRTLLFTLLALTMLPDDYSRKHPIDKYLLFVDIIRKGFFLRSDRPFDPNFYPQVEQNQSMLDPSFVRQCLRSIIKKSPVVGLSSFVTDDELTGETTHLSVIDSCGMAVSLTQSIERVYGSKVAADGLGFLYNNYLYDFDYSFPEHPYYLRPNSVPWATVAPTIVSIDNNVWMAVGSPGSERIISTLALFLWRIADESMSIDQAMIAPRIHSSLGGKVSYESARFDPALEYLLTEKGLRVDKRDDFAFYLGCIQAVIKCRSCKGFQGVADVRRDGTALGL